VLLSWALAASRQPRQSADLSNRTRNQVVSITPEVAESCTKDKTVVREREAVENPLLGELRSWKECYDPRW